MSLSSDSCRPRRRISTVLKQRRANAGHASGGEGISSSAGGPAGRMSSADVEHAFRALLEETLPPDKQEALMETFEAEGDAQMRYNMLLEFSSYLRQGSQNGKGGYSGEPYDADDKYRPKPRARPYGRPGLDDDDDDANLCWEICRVILIVAAILLAVLGAGYALGNTLEQEGNGRMASVGATVHVGMGSDEPDGDESDV